MSNELLIKSLITPSLTMSYTSREVRLYRIICSIESLKILTCNEMISVFSQMDATITSASNIKNLINSKMNPATTKPSISAKAIQTISPLTKSKKAFLQNYDEAVLSSPINRCLNSSLSVGFSPLALNMISSR